VIEGARGLLAGENLKSLDISGVDETKSFASRGFKCLAKNFICLRFRLQVDNGREGEESDIDLE